MKNFLVLLASILVFYSCSQDSLSTSALEVSFEHTIGEEPIEFDQMIYENAAGNEYEVTEIQWFISDLKLKRKDGSMMAVDESNFAHYVDTNIPSTFNWRITEEIPLGDYESITMTFGIKGEKNIPFMFTDPPESDMLWPMQLGGDQGGYHYMKLNGFWNNIEEEREPFNFHLGVGQERDTEGEIIGFVQNWFEVELPNSSFSATGPTTKVKLRMNVDRWWDTPNIYDHDEMGSRIMQNQEAMGKGVENGRNVFSLVKSSDINEALTSK